MKSVADDLVSIQPGTVLVLSQVSVLQVMLSVVFLNRRTTIYGVTCRVLNREVNDQVQAV